jgi:hypothetical protein
LNETGVMAFEMEQISVADTDIYVPQYDRDGSSLSFGNDLLSINDICFLKDGMVWARFS